MYGHFNLRQGLKGRKLLGKIELKHMHIAPNRQAKPQLPGFTLIELLVVILIASILMTAAAIGINGLGGKSVTSAVSQAEALFDEARATAKSRCIRSCVLVAKSLNNNSSDDLRRIVVAYEQVDPVSGEPLAAPDEEPDWELSSRGSLLPDKVYFSEQLSKLDHENGTGVIPTVNLNAVKSSYRGEYYIYPFNSEGVCLNPGSSFVIGSGARNEAQTSVAAAPVVTSAGRRDFGGFVVWRNGGTSLFRNPDQISESLPAPGEEF